MRALGIVNFEDSTASIQGLQRFRSVPSIAFMGRYRIIDFILSNMTNSGIDNVFVFCKEKPRNLFEHLGDGQHYNINSKRGKLRLLFGERPFSSPVYNTDIANFLQNIQYIEEDTNPYVILAPSYFLYSLDFNKVLSEHKETGADVTVLYGTTNNAQTQFIGCDTLLLDKEKHVTGVIKNRGRYKNRNISAEAFVMSKETFLGLIKDAAKTSSLYWLKDILNDKLEELDIRGYKIPGFMACINSLEEYYRISMELRNYDNAVQLFKEDWPIYTQTNDSSPTKYGPDAEIKGSVIANGCNIEGIVKGSVIGRNVKIGAGSKIIDSVILSGTTIGDGVTIDHAIVDKYAIVKKVKELKGTAEEPLYVERRDRI